MTTALTPDPLVIHTAVGTHPAAFRFAAACTTVIVVACLLAGFAPLGFSIATVFLFAGPHNWFEARYMLSRMPARWGPLAGYFLFGIGGVVSLTLAAASLPLLAEAFAWSNESWLTALSVWNSALYVWLAALVVLRSKQNPRRQWPWTVPVCCVLIAAAWLQPLLCSLALVFLHPLLALWFLDRELGRQKSGLRFAYRGSLLVVAAGLVVLWFRLAGAPNLPGDDPLRAAIADHAGGGILRGVSTHFLVAAHTFLEMLHYGVWIVAIPLVSMAARPWDLNQVPLARRSAAWRTAVVAILAAGGIVVVLLWGAFLADYPVTRYVYFTVAMLHVLAEVPFLLRLL